MIITRILFIIFLFWPFFRTEFTCKSDTINIKINGADNHVQLNDTGIITSTILCDTLNVKGEVTQKGCKNTIEISTEIQSPKNKQQIKISQKGTNNRVKINSQ